MSPIIRNVCLLLLILSVGTTAGADTDMNRSLLRYLVENPGDESFTLATVRDNAEGTQPMSDELADHAARWSLKSQVTQPVHFDSLLEMASRMQALANVPSWAKALIEDESSKLKLLQSDYSKTFDEATESKSILDTEHWQEINQAVHRSATELFGLRAFVWEKNLWETPQSEEMPAENILLTEKTIKACIGEYESAAFMISNMGIELLDAHIQMSDLKPESNVPVPVPSNHITFHDVLVYPRKEGRVLADALPISSQIRRLQVPPGQSRQVWMTLDTSDVIPGDYTGVLEIHPFDRRVPVRKIILKVKILPIHLPEQMPIAVYSWDDTATHAQMRDLIKHRVNRFLIPFNTCYPEVDAQGNITQLDFTLHDRWLRVKGLRIGELVYSYGVVQEYHKIVTEKAKLEFMSEPWKKGLKEWITRLVFHIKSLGYDYKDFSMQIWDQATGEDVEKVIAVGSFLREIDPNIRWVMDGSQTADEVRRMNPYVDIWIPHLNALNSPATGSELYQVYKDIQAAGKPVWAYTCDINMADQPVNSYYRLKPWWVWSLGLDGECCRAYNSWHADSWDEIDERPDCGVIYPTDGEPVTSRRWEASREGLDDYLYLYLLRETIKASDKLKMNTAEAARLLKELPEKVLQSGENSIQVQQARDTILELLVQLQAVLPPLKTPRLDFRNMGDAVMVMWQTAPDADARIYYKTKDDTQWMSEKAVGMEGSMQVLLRDLDPYRDYQFVLVVWDKLGRVVVAPVDEMPSMQRLPVLPG